METYADNCVRSYFEVKVGTFKTLELYNKGAGECSYLTIRNTYPGVSDDSRIMGRFLEIVSLKGQERESELASDPDAGAIKALLGIDQYVSASFMEAMAKHCTWGVKTRRPRRRANRTMLMPRSSSNHGPIAAVSEAAKPQA